MKASYLDYEHLQYYHEKLKFELDSMIISEDGINKLLYADRSLTVQNNGFFRIKFGVAYDGGSGTNAAVPLEWETSNFTINGFTDYSFKNAFTLTEQNSLLVVYNSQYYSVNYDYEADGIAFELMCKDNNNKTHYYTTIGRAIPNYENSDYASWSLVSTKYYESQRLNSYLWNFIPFSTIPVGSSKTYHFNYHADSYDASSEGPLDRASGVLSPMDEFEITIFHNIYKYYSVMLYWDPSKSLYV